MSRVKNYYWGEICTTSTTASIPTSNYTLDWYGDSLSFEQEKERKRKKEFDDLWL